MPYKKRKRIIDADKVLYAMGAYVFISILMLIAYLTIRIMQAYVSSGQLDTISLFGVGLALFLMILSVVGNMEECEWK